MSGGKQAAAELKAQFPGWHVWPSSAGRWWATRTGTVLDRPAAGHGPEGVIPPAGLPPALPHPDGAGPA